MSSVNHTDFKDIHVDYRIATDSYELFFEHFSIAKTDFYEWGIESTIFPDISVVEKEWENLKYRIFHNEKVFIRGYGRDAHGTALYKGMYQELFGNSNVTKDPTNNAEPQKIIQRLTGLKRNQNIFNYQVSHIWGHTKNIFMFEAPWNICYVPKMIDPFTGHETKGVWPGEYQELFLKKAYQLYSPFIDDYNDILIKCDVKRRMHYYLDGLQGKMDARELMQFSKDVENEIVAL